MLYLTEKLRCTGWRHLSEATWISFRIADDDTFYPENWLENLKLTAEKNPKCVVCYRAQKMKIDNLELTKMSDLRRYIYTKKPNENVTLKINRGKIKKDIVVQLGK